ncbi:alpha/beta hydrolase [Paracnuella aquatica]|uniref:alpha/beta hydrolase n=1 Tax=Paracnuella aquatica TaxID=2268757 RepID=UPI000DEF346E|nr:alpha/beta fold hydrolase [Paracnuella aquatica]RPD51109.1 alpha/beta fold hydrolase [Paracnuella aquatica]
MSKYTILPLLLLLCTAATAQMDERFYFPSKDIKPALDSVPHEDVVLPVDSAQITGIFIKPPGKPKATVLFFHGAGGNVSSYLFMTKPLVAAGYQVFMADLRGYGKSTGKPTHRNIAADGQVLFNYLLARPDVKGTKLVIYGASMGTQVAANLARNNAAKVSALVLDGNIASFSDIAADHSPEAQREMIRKGLPSPYSAKEDIKHIGAVPVLFIHSKEDKDVPFSHAEMVYQNAPGKKSWLVYSGKHLEATKADEPGVINAINGMIK